MDSASQPDTPPGEPPSIFSNLLGIVIALMTLTLPMAAIAHFSSSQGLPPPGSAPPSSGLGR
ncbi:hypothetical protein GFS31_00880 [Leptolyngbya sp. BL0902]|nr:hypothetical protein GFS31_00880 [Leptolyngbya sp. BL0902]